MGGILPQGDGKRWVGGKSHVRRCRASARHTEHGQLSVQQLEHEEAVEDEDEGLLGKLLGTWE